MFGLMTVAQDGLNLECEFRHLSLAEYLTALHIHITGDTLQVKEKPLFNPWLRMSHSFELLLV